MATPHIEAAPGAFAPTVLMPGDPLRAKHIAENFFENPVQVNGIRGMLGFTGKYKGKPVSAMGSGMGIPSVSIYSKELFTEYDVQTIIRVGSCGTVVKNAQLREVVIGIGACTDSKVNRARFGGHDFAAVADFDLAKRASEAAESLGIPVRSGNLFSADLFYTPETEMFDRMEKMGIVGIEMEAAGLYGCAAEFGRKALAICTVSDHIRTGEDVSAECRQSSFDDMVKIALECIS